MNAAALNKLPVIFCVQDNGYAISVPVEVQTAGGSISRLVSGFPNFHFEEVDGTDPVASYGGVSACRAILPRGPWSGVCACACDSSVFAFAFRRRTLVPSGCRARARCGARSGFAHADVSAARGHSRRKGHQRTRKESRRRAAGCGGPGARGLAARARERDAVCVFARSRSDVGGVRHAGGSRARFRRRQEAGGEDHGRPDQRYAARRDEARRAHRDLRRRRGRLQPRRISQAQAGERARAESSS